MRLFRRKPARLDPPTGLIPLVIGPVTLVVEAWPVEEYANGYTRIDFRPYSAVIRTDTAPWNREDSGT